MPNAIPTEYAGIRFRSRLEATWAVFFDLMGWPWEYEPFDLAGYIPDFILPNPCAVDGAERSVVVDVKPLSSWLDLCERGYELLDCGWRGEIAVVGTSPLPGISPPDWKAAAPCLGHHITYWTEEVAGWSKKKAGLVDLREHFGENGERSLFQGIGDRLRKYGWAEPLAMIKCGCCGRLSFDIDSYSCPLCAEELLRWVGDDLKELYEPADFGLIRSLWATSKNRTQWRGTFGG